LLVAGIAGAFWLMSPKPTTAESTDTPRRAYQVTNNKGDEGEPGPETSPKAKPPDEGGLRPCDVKIVQSPTGTGRALVINEARLVPADRNEVPAEHDGKLVMLGTELKPDELKLITDLKREFRNSLPAN